MNVLAEIAAERARQIAEGYTPKHDDEHTLAELTRFMDDRLSEVRYIESKGLRDDYCRRALVEVAALALAAVESLDRRGSLPTTLEGD